MIPGPDAWNAAAFASAVALAVAAPAWLGAGGARGGTPAVAEGSASAPAPRRVVDASGVAVPVRPYERVVSGSPTADALLLELASRDRLVAVTAWAASGPRGHRYAGLPTIERVSDVERLLALRPDLVVLHDYGELDTVTRLREAGLAVFDLGAATGVDALVEDARLLGALLGVPERGEAFARSFERRMRAVAGDVALAERPRAAYVAVYGDRLFGAAAGSSQHDVLVHAGLRDVAAESGLRGWPQYTPEGLLTLAPRWVVTQPGMAEALCRQPGLAAFPPCQGRDGTRVVETPGLDDAGPAMLEATERLHELAFGRPGALPDGPDPR